ncbi:MAG: UDP-N-acetylmuramoyl-tripeptide--D-alanyl-D-alanine ligase [Clostridia bacterium]|nr:UDP-N-acetylmuramoyl-tripeptide--D-alanyl-D-alanine ligase [Clostridia bacterium]
MIKIIVVSFLSLCYTFIVALSGINSLCAFQQFGYKYSPYLKWEYININRINLNKNNANKKGAIKTNVNKNRAKANKTNKLKSAKRQKLTLTKRAFRIILLFLLICITLSCFVNMWLYKRLYLSFLYFAFLLYFKGFLIVLTDFLLTPIKLIEERFYIKRAQKKLSSNKEVKIIAITGSFGKTSLKDILFSLLKQKYTVFKTPHSFNTPMGICKCINEGYKNEQVFICEMGATKRGDIKTLCKYFPVDIGVITAVSDQHLSSFKTLGGVLDGKYEMAQNVKKDGKTYFSADDLGTRFLHEKFYGKKSLAGVCCSKEIKGYTWNGKGYDLNLEVDGQNFTAKLNLLGEHNVSNVALALKIAVDFNLTKEEIKKGIEDISPTPHRLQLIEGQNGITVLDDSFNSNPKGAKYALEVLKLFNGTKTVITSGFVELGEHEWQENYNLGVNLTKSADVVILVGKVRAQAILKGIESQEIKPLVYVVDCLSQAVGKLNEFCKRGDVVLFLNDLPDIYL